MGLQGPLTAQALGRSPYDDVVIGGPEDGATPSQIYDHRGRPMNPRSKQINRSIIRAHNEVMHVVGVAEPDNPHDPDEYESKRQHSEYETAIGLRLIWATKRCIGMVGALGLNGFRQRVLVYEDYSRTPCWDLYQNAQRNFSFAGSMLPGAHAYMLAEYIERNWNPQWSSLRDRSVVKEYVGYAWSYVTIHLQLYSCLQRLGLISSTQLLPSWRFLESLIPAPPPLEDFTPRALLKWASGAVISVAPLLVWTATRRLTQQWRFRTWQRIFTHIPNPIIGGQEILTLDDMSEPSDDSGEDLPMPSTSQATEGQGVRQEREQMSGDGIGNHDDGVSPQSTSEEEQGGSSSQADTGAHTSADDYGSDDDDGDENEGVSATLISFDVEATEATEVPQGMWSAELRSSTGPDARSGSSAPTYLSTMLTRLPALTAANIATDRIVRLLTAPHEAMTLRLVARVFCAQHGLPCDDVIFGFGLLSGLNATWLLNFFWTELTHFALSAEIWSVFTIIAQYFHKSEKEWEDFDSKDWGDLGPFKDDEPICWG
ncbi:hypothetical protein GMORB2_2901 [Geosmithia morbida]|uniref:Uncharacterized protein n=1 Tax=Geosmithia morbida TaxID=1094350 RepID=A0A9P4YRN7_9HYPO|nr:uncharacterized protein GMORB2_2901 [Geosmithia morbida]KAF4120463.1 hypothetical protein GMORB2_2901 [Geosmithia morbida]